MRRDIHNSDIPVVCQSCEVRHRGICGALDPAELIALGKVTRRVHYTAGEVLVADGDTIGSYGNLMSGVVKLSKMLSDGRQQVVGLQFAPDFVGRIYGEVSEVTAEAASDVELCRVPRGALEALVASFPAAGRKLFQQALVELDEARTWMVTLGRKTAAEKVASFLYLIANHIDPHVMGKTGVSTAFDLPLTRADIADFLGLTVETVSRQLTRLRAEDVIEITNNRHVVILDTEQLLERCG